ncbi:hypothetical protein P152DRAFT_468737 [Eremomyces bilateralis CBS 781.70]|uniref:Disintegrin and metalloproteinase domain-containing protein B n=1 Tax=Eremomyces bilateralis CBS 781.70 TaxID=1392243 RepID=A0A6G1FSR5_9PEZI|nr:uncharacterized protein P152DRAFT_468737 [Eremomyces bilateralis CBS 781.70]KAF1808827.1 hypothetical protein P152DRAFT_468737 [Eremomyces bilateralis CBS 781.70]
MGSVRERTDQEIYCWIYSVARVISYTLVSGSSVTRNPLTHLGVVTNPTIHTPSHRVNALSSFDLSFDLHGQRIRLALEPNYDILPEGATIEYLGVDGEVLRREPIERQDHKVFKGSTWVDGTRAGHARIVVFRDGIYPLFQGSFDVGSNHHHVQLDSHYMSTKHEFDPQLDARDDEYMVCFRDSDIATEQMHTELRRSVEPSKACLSDGLEFNTQPDHPVYRAMLKRDDNFWGTPIESLFGKRQIDSRPGGGNAGGINLASSVGQTAGCPTTRKVALVGVATDCEYSKAFNSTESARLNVIQQMNSASDLYERTFNISLGLANLTVSEQTCPGTPPPTQPYNIPCGGADIQERLNIFSGWRGERKDQNSHWMLLTNCPTGTAVGLAWLGQACVNEALENNSTRNGQMEITSGANVVAKTSTEWQVIAHETGHTFGAVHDCTSESCNDGVSLSSQQCCPLSSSTCNAGEQFIMNPSTARGITAFSACSIGNICTAFRRNSVRTSCFTDNRGVTTISGQQCGNGIVEPGEDCDCGGADDCGDNTCCDAATCKFTAGSQCDDSNEDCCDSCKYAPSTRVCRASTGECDPQETCAGNSATCPKDDRAPDGQGCGDGLKCSSGQCTSRDLQCKTVMGSYTRNNDTYSCDHTTCQLSCQSPEFGPGRCYGLNQNFLDGTECGGGGKCQNGRCTGSSFAKEVGSWIETHKPIVIGVSCGVGGLLLLALLSCLWSCIRRRRGRSARRAPTWPPVPPNQIPGMHQGTQWSPSRGPGGPPMGGPGQPPVPEQGGWYPPPAPVFARGQSVRYA